jgi:hypothetical protein
MRESPAGKHCFTCARVRPRRDNSWRTVSSDVLVLPVTAVKMASVVLRIMLTQSSEPYVGALLISSASCCEERHFVSPFATHCSSFAIMRSHCGAQSLICARVRPRRDNSWRRASSHLEGSSRFQALLLTTKASRKLPQSIGAFASVLDAVTRANGGPATTRRADIMIASFKALAANRLHFCVLRSHSYLLRSHSSLIWVKTVGQKQR